MVEQPMTSKFNMHGRGRAYDMQFHPVLLDEYREHLESRHLSDTYIVGGMGSLYMAMNHLRAHGYGCMPDDVTEEGVKWLVGYNALSLNTRGTFVNLLKQFYLWAGNPIIGDMHIRMPPNRDAREDVQWLTNEQDDRLHALLTDRENGGKRMNAFHRLAVLLMADGLLRHSEASHIRMGDADLKKRMMTIRGKGNKTRKVPMTEDLVWAWGEMVKARDMMLRKVTGIARHSIPDEVFIYVAKRKEKTTNGAVIGKKAVWTALTYSGAVGSRHWEKKFVYPVRQLCIAMGIGDWTCHTLRRTTATRMYEAGCDLLDLARIMGHASVQTTSDYITRPNDSLLGAVDKLRLIRSGRSD